jgi:hypothetical protein
MGIRSLWLVRRSCARSSIGAIAVAIASTGCSAGLSDAETAWCDDHGSDVWRAAESLGLTADAAIRDWSRELFELRLSEGRVAWVHIPDAGSYAAGASDEGVAFTVAYPDTWTSSDVRQKVAFILLESGREGSVETRSSRAGQLDRDAFARACRAAFEGR